MASGGQHGSEAALEAGSQLFCSPPVQKHQCAATAFTLLPPAWTPVSLVHSLVKICSVCPADEDGSKLHQKNVYGIDKPFGNEEKRKDGNYEMSWRAVALPQLRVYYASRTRRAAGRFLHAKAVHMLSSDHDLSARGNAMHGCCCCGECCQYR